MVLLSELTKLTVIDSLLQVHNVHYTIINFVYNALSPHL